MELPELDPDGDIHEQYRFHHDGEGQHPDTGPAAGVHHVEPAVTLDDGDRQRVRPSRQAVEGSQPPDDAEELVEPDRDDHASGDAEPS